MCGECSCLCPEVSNFLLFVAIAGPVIAGSPTLIKLESIKQTEKYSYQVVKAIIL